MVKIKNEIKNKHSGIFAALVCCVALLSALYVYFVGHTIYSVAKRGSVEKLIATLESDTQNLESRYIILKNGITESYARDKGFTDIAGTQYIYRGPLGQGISFNRSL
ncbi:hypothetical protein KGQ31_02910 [Patescibacteria group bacterium]|nr:hypothetical protein [Patescibacteria group bacterium]